MRLKIRRFIFFLLVFPFFALSDEVRFCGLLDHWKIPVCAKTNKERLIKSDHLHTQLEASLLRKKILPKEATEAGKAVFQIGTQFSFRGYEWGFAGGSGFFMFDAKTFFTAYHALEAILSGISDWNEVVFKDQNGNQKGFRIKGIKFASKLRDIAILEVEGYEGPVLELSAEPLQEQSYIIGYSEGFEIQSARAFEVNNIYYGAFLELFDCYYGFSFGGYSGGPIVNKEGKVKGVFTNMIHSPFTGCPFLLGRKLDFLTEGTQSNPINDLDAAKELMLLEQDKIVELAINGNMDAMFELLGAEPFAFDFFRENTEAILSDNLLIKHVVVDIIMKEYVMEEGIEDTVKMTGALLTLFKPQDILPVTWYIKGFVDYYVHKDLKTACKFWDRAGQAGHPLVFQDFVIAPDETDIISCKF